MTTVSGRSIGGDKLAKLDRRWFVMQHHFVFYWGAEQDFLGRVKPKGAIPLMDVVVNDPKVRTRAPWYRQGSRHMSTGLGSAGLRATRG